MPEATDEQLAKIVGEGSREAYRIAGPRDTADSRYLGVVGVSKYYPSFHSSDMFPFTGELSPDSRFVLRAIPSDPSRLFVLFRQFDSSPYQAFPEDLVAGWVPIDLEIQARQWVDEMNSRIKGFGVKQSEPLVTRESPALNGVTEPAIRSMDAIEVHFHVRTIWLGPLGDLVKQIEALLGCQFRQLNNAMYDGMSAFEASSLGMSIQLIEFPAVGSYPKRFALTGVPSRTDLPAYKGEIDLSQYVQERFSRDGVVWYLASADELRTEAGL